MKKEPYRYHKFVAKKEKTREERIKEGEENIALALLRYGLGSDARK
jgi:hypothetical protein